MPAPRPDPAGESFGDYELLARLGRGGMAEVHRARMKSGPRRGQEVAIKRLLPEVAKDPEHVRQFLHEAELCLALDHPNVVRTYAAGEHDGRSFMVMEYVEGRDLGQILRRCRERALPLPIDFGVFLARALLEALAYAHTAKTSKGEPLGLVHCDVSPSNLFISRTGEIKLGDFGVARARIDPAGPQEVSGKPYYLSPEVLQGEISIQTDLWAANVVLYEALTLQRPFIGSTADEVLGKVRRREYRRVRSLRAEVSPGLEAVVDRGFSADVSRRYASAAEFAQTLEGHYDERIGTPLAIAAVVRGLFD